MFTLPRRRRFIRRLIDGVICRGIGRINRSATATGLIIAALGLLLLIDRDRPRRGLLGWQTRTFQLLPQHARHAPFQ